MLSLKFLRKKYPRFVYRGFNIKHSDKNLKITYDFLIEPNIFFRPEIEIKNVSRTQIKRTGKRALQNLAFHYGLAEIPSYWKATCSPEIIIEAGRLDTAQICWWKDLFIKGMGQFFYENKIDFNRTDFVSIKNRPIERSIGLFVRQFKKEYMDRSPVFKYRAPISVVFKNRYLVPLAGGRDSIVTVELLKKGKKDFIAFCVNPTKETKDVMRVAGIKKPIVVKRKIDPKLFELNKRGYLNGHTPFTSVLSFLSALCAVLFDCRHIAFSNEKSANEGNVRYLGMLVNHQYSKSTEFEKKFSVYAKKYLARNIHYFSLLRPYPDLEISKMFIEYPQYFSVFSSCNRARNLGKRWCRECPKCLFVYMTLYPFLDKKQLLKIFGQDLFQNKKLLPILKNLIDPKRIKPFECVGTKKECQNSFILSKAKAEKDRKLPYLLRVYKYKND